LHDKERAREFIGIVVVNVNGFENLKGMFLAPSQINLFLFIHP
jgi:hypothetical protein